MGKGRGWRAKASQRRTRSAPFCSSMGRERQFTPPQKGVLDKAAQILALGYPHPSKLTQRLCTELAPSILPNPDIHRTAPRQHQPAPVVSLTPSGGVASPM
jgi:hypothetical protein